MKKILFLMQLPPPVHGASLVNECIRNSGIINSNFDSCYVNTAPGDDISDIGSFSLKKFLGFFLILCRALKAYLLFRPDLVYLTLSPHGIAFYKDAVLCVLMKLIGGRVVFHMHGKGIKAEVEGSRLKKYIYKFVFREVNVVHLSECLFSDVEPVRDPSKEIFCLNNGVDSPDGLGDAHKNEVFTFLYLSNIGPSKGAHLLVEAADIMTKNGIEGFNVFIYGKANDVEYLESIQQTIASNGLTNVSILGPVYGDDKYRCLSEGHVFVLPTRYRNECFPLSILEAMSCGLPVISTDEGAIPDIVDSDFGVIVEDLTPIALAEAMELFLVDKAFYQNASKLARKKYLDRYTVSRFELNFVDVLEKVCRT